jgi:hypothetical protein
MENQLNRFTQLFINALNQIDSFYYSTAYMGLPIPQRQRGMRQWQDGTFTVYGERMFCYELYYYLRTLIDLERKRRPNFLDNALLQGEVKKHQILDLLDSLGLEPLSRDFIPDLLMHTPGSADLNAFVIEVKCVPRLSSESMFIDLAKINEFVLRYGYLRGIFLTVNTEPDYIQGLLQENAHRIQHLEGRGSITVLCKQTSGVQSVMYPLA